MPFEPPPIIPPFLLAILNVVVVELRAVAEFRPDDARIRSAVSSIEAAIRTLSTSQD